MEHDDGLAAAFSDIKKHQVESSEVVSSVEHELDGVHDGLVFPTEEEKQTLRRVSDSIPWNAYCESPLVAGLVSV